MSLLDAFLNEPYRDPRDVYIALRKDGQCGSGTIDDAYNGSTQDYPTVPVETLSKSDSVATVVTQSEHGFTTGDMVTIRGVDTGIAADRFYTGTFPVEVLTNTSFQYPLRYAPTSSPAPGTIICVREREPFDTILRALPANSVIHLGPGVFETKGSAGGIVNWDLKHGQRILGSGRGVTTLKLVQASWPELLYAILGDENYASFIEDFEVSDLAFDCNIAGQPNPLVSTSAVGVRGRHVRLHRLRAFNFSSQTVGYVENFVFSVGVPHPHAGAGKEGVNNVIEDCIAENPGLNASNNSSVFILSSGEADDGIMVYHRACAIRRCWYDGTVNDRPVPIASITIAAGVATVTTRVKHGREADDWVVIAGAEENGSPESAYNGSYVITSATDYQFTYNPVAYGGMAVPTTSPTGDMWVDRYSSHPISVKKVERDPEDSTLAILTTHGPHNRKPDQWVRVIPQRIVVGTEAYFSTTLNVLDSEFGGFPIVEGGITAPNVLKYRMVYAPTFARVQDLFCTPPVTLDDPPACAYAGAIFLGVRNAGFSTDGGSEAVAEGNRVFNAGIGGSYHDTWGTRDQTDRSNYYSDVGGGPYQNMGLSSIPKEGSWDPNGTTVTFTTALPHGLVIGQAVRITNNLPFPLELSNFYQVATVPSPFSFTFETHGKTPPGNYFGALWQVGLAIRRNNFIELGKTHHVTTGGNYSSGISFSSGLHDDQYVYRSVIVSGNVIKLTPGSVNPPAWGIQLRNVEKGVIERNVIDVQRQLPVDVELSKPVHFFGNASSAGVLLQPSSGATANDLRSRIQDALVLAL